MRKDPQLAVADLLIQVRRSALYNLPVGHSSIPFDLLLMLFANYARGAEPLSLKLLFGSLPYSEMGMRYHLNALIREGWVQVEKGVRDNRLRLIRPTTQLLDRFNHLVRDVSHLLAPGVPSLRH